MLGDPLSLEVHASSITVRMPGTDYWITYESATTTRDLPLCEAGWPPVLRRQQSPISARAHVVLLSIERES